MADILFHYERVNPTSWAYLSSLLMLALYFKFNRIWSMRNVDLFLLIALAPGLLLVQWASENMAPGQQTDDIEHYGFLWLFLAGGLLLLRLLFDSAMVRRPLLDPNLNSAGLLFMGFFMLFFLMANVVTGDPRESDLSPARGVEQVRAEEGEETEQGQPDSFTTDGPGFWLVYSMPRIVTQRIIRSEQDDEPTTISEEEQQQLAVREATAKVIAILAHTMIVLGVIAIGYWHFENLTAGIAVATLYLMLPYTALWTGDVLHCLPGSLLVCAVVLYRYPFLSGLMVGLASGTIYYPAFLLFLWCSFYWERGLRRFVGGFLLMILVLVGTLAFTATSFDMFLDRIIQMFGLRSPTDAVLGGIWTKSNENSWSYYTRFPVIAAFVGLSISFAIWPLQKNLATLISGTAAVMLAAQFWHAYSGGIFIAWYLPLLLLTIFRPNLEDRTALAKIGPGWLKQRAAVSSG